MKKKQVWDKKLFLNYEPSVQVYIKGILVMEKLGKLNTRMSNAFPSYKVPTRIFAFIESKYSSRIEGIYTTLFDVVNTGVETQQQKIIKPLVDALFEERKILNVKSILEIEDVMNFNKTKSKRFEPEFGIYKTTDDKKELIYEPPKAQKEVEKLLEMVISKAENDKNIIDMLHTHIIFEKIHPFIDANGRIGRLILQRSLARTMNYTSIIPLSWAFFANLGKYYESFEISNNQDINNAIEKLLDIVLKMYEETKKFVTEIEEFANKYKDKIKGISRVITDEIALRILLTLQTKSSFLQQHFGLNHRTIDKIFQELPNIGLDFNTKIINRNKTFWNIELEQIIDAHYR